MVNEFCSTSWTRLKNVVLSSTAFRHQKESLKSQFNDDSPSSVNYIVSILKSEQEERQTKINKLKKRIDAVQKLYISKRRTMHEVQDKLDKKSIDFDKLVDKNDVLVEKLRENIDTLELLRKTIVLNVRLLAFRKVYMVQEVVDIFKIEIDGGPASKQPKKIENECKCVLVDTIRNLHLPQISCVQVPGHSEVEITSSVGYVIQVLEAICTILDYPLRYPIVHASSNSKIIFPMENNRVVPLYGWKKRLDRDSFQEGLVWLGKNIAQLRSDCGIPTPVADKTLSVLADWVRSVGGGFRKYVCIYERPTESILSPSSLLINYQ